MGSNLNRIWAEGIVRTLVECGVDRFFISPGARSAPLALALSTLKKECVITHFDERGMGFCALGYAKRTGRPGVCVTTSGSAVANLYPAVVEAYYSETPLLLFTADRPPELHDMGTNQTIQQAGIFGSLVLWQTSLPCPVEAVPFVRISSMVTSALKVATGLPAGPVHINCPFREPLLPSLPLEKNSEEVGGVELNIVPDAYGRCYAGGNPRRGGAISARRDAIQFVEQFAGLCGVILVGELAVGDQTSNDEILRMAKMLGWPVLVDPLSGFSLCESNYIARHYDLFLKQKDVPLPEVVLHLGGRMVSKRLGEFLRAVRGDHYWHVQESPRRCDAYGLNVSKFDLPIRAFCHEVTLQAPKATSDAWITTWISTSRMVERVVEEMLDKNDVISEPGVARLISQLAPDGAVMFLGNSMPIRDFDMVAGPGRAQVPIVIGNRGASGIDGNIATLFGLAEASKSPVTAILGDLATLHDLNSLALEKCVNGRVILIVVNNGGGGIFRFLPLSFPTDQRERLMETPHEYEFEALAKGFGLNYRKVKMQDELRDIYRQALKEDGSWLIEVQTNREENWELHQKMMQKVELTK